MAKPVICFLIMFNFIGCEDSITESSQVIELYPLRVGNYWQYRFYSFDTVGNKEDMGVLLSEKVVRDTLINGNKWSILSVRSYFSGEAAYINKSDGFYYRGDNKDYLKYKYPANVGDLFGDSIMVVSVNHKVSSIVGDLNCIGYKQKERYDETVSWTYSITYVAPGYGKIKAEHYQSNDRMVWKKNGELSLDSCRLY